MRFDLHRIGTTIAETKLLAGQEFLAHGPRRESIRKCSGKRLLSVGARGGK